MKKKPNKRNRVDEEANFIGDILRLLFALSILVVTVVAAFLLVKNIAGFKLPNLKETDAPTEQSKEAVVITAKAKEKKETSKETKAEESAGTAESESKKESSEEAKETDSDKKKESSSKEESASKEKEVIGESPTAAGKKSEGQKEESKSSKNGGADAAIGDAPKSAGDDAVEEGPGVN